MRELDRIERRRSETNVYRGRSRVKTVDVDVGGPATIFAMNESAVLIFSLDPFAAALIGAAAELAGFAVWFPRRDESARDALMRTRPSVALIDCDHQEACTESFFGPALMTGAAIAIFSSSRSRRTLEPIAAEYGVHTFALPVDVAELSRILTESSTRAST